MKKSTISPKVRDAIFDMTVGYGYDGPMADRHVARLAEINGRDFTCDEMWQLDKEWEANLRMMAQP